MRKLLGVVYVSLVLAAGAVAADRTVVVPKDDKPFTVESTAIVRLTGKGIAGSEIEAKVTAGPAKIENTNTVFERAGGGNVIGNSIKEFEIKSTGKGKVKVKVSVKSPTGGEKETEYEFEFK